MQATTIISLPNEKQNMTDDSKIQVDEDVYILALDFIITMSAWLTGDHPHTGQGGRHIRDCYDDVILDLPELLWAIEDGRWPVEVK